MDKKLLMIVWVNGRQDRMTNQCMKVFDRFIKGHFNNLLMLK